MDGFSGVVKNGPNLCNLGVTKTKVENSAWKFIED